MGEKQTPCRMRADIPEDESALTPSKLDFLIKAFM